MKMVERTKTDKVLLNEITERGNIIKTRCQDFTDSPISGNIMYE